MIRMIRSTARGFARVTLLGRAPLDSRFPFMVESCLLRLFCDNQRPIRTLPTMRLHRLVFVSLVPVALTGLAFGQSTPPREVDPRVEQLVAAVSESRLNELVNKLAAFGTRNTLSGTMSATRGIGAARQWIFDELQRSSPRLQVSFDTFKVAKNARITRDVELRNVLAVLPAKSARRIYLTAHYDTVNIGGAGQIGSNRRPSGQTAAPQLRADQDYDVDAPGTNGNGSGTALTMELARVLAASSLDFDTKIVFERWAGEE